MNALFDDDNQSDAPQKGQHSSQPNTGGELNPAAELVRAKVNQLYANEPDARQEMQEAAQNPKPRSKHQQFMHDLSTSGKSLAHIQQAWHNYYASLPAEEKLEVWREFYQANNQQASAFTRTTQNQSLVASPRRTLPTSTADSKHRRTLERSLPHGLPQSQVISGRDDLHNRPGNTHKKPHRARFKTLQNRVLHKIRANAHAQTKAKQHAKSLLFGLGLGFTAIVILLFSFFNEVVIARLIQPSGSASATPIILNTDGISPTDEPQLIIPKINVQLPLVFDIPSNQEEVIQDALDEGVIHYPNTSLPGQQGNGAYFGHSSNNIFNSGKYKFAFVLLRELVPGDIFYITYEGTVFTYRTYDKRIVSPDETWVLGNAPGKIATAALITCDPPGTTLNRLVVWGEQITPDPATNSQAPTPDSSRAQELPAQGPTLWGRLWNWITGSE